MTHPFRYTQDNYSEENINDGEKYNETGESSYSRDLTIPYDMNDELIERHLFRKKRKDFSGMGPKGYNKTDERIWDEACEALYKSPEVDASEIEVKVSNGVITLLGTVENREVKRVAERTIESISGAIDIQNRITVRRGEGGLIQNSTGMI